jgi:hypothetical protein
MTSSNNSRERVDLARSFCGDIFPVGRPVVVAIDKSGNHTSGNPAVRFRYYPQSAPGHSSRRVSGNWAGMKRCFPISALPALFFPETGGTFLRGVVNSCAAIGRHSLLPLKPLQKSQSGLSKCFRRLSLVVVHVTQHDRRTRQSAVKE